MRRAIDQPAATRPRELESGTILEGRYEVVRAIGRGSFATVYEVRHRALLSRLALKVLNIDLGHDEELRIRFIEEGRIQAQLRHPNIVSVNEIVTDPVAGLVMELVEGPNLDGFLQEKGGRLEMPKLVELMLPILEGVEAAHRQGVIHRDLKPENILIGRDALDRLQPKVVDFGIAKVLDQSTLQSKKRRTVVGTRMGTIVYMSPEQIRSSDQVDARSDIFSLGAILFEVATGQVAFDAGNDFDTMSKIVSASFTPPQELVPDLHPIVDSCIRIALAPDPAERFQSCKAFHQALRAALVAETSTVSFPPPAFRREEGEVSSSAGAGALQGETRVETSASPSSPGGSASNQEPIDPGPPSPSGFPIAGARAGDTLRSPAREPAEGEPSDAPAEQQAHGSMPSHPDAAEASPAPAAAATSPSPAASAAASPAPTPPRAPSRPIPPPTWPRLTAALPQPEDHVDTEIQDAVRFFFYCVTIGVIVGALILLFS